MKGEQVTPRYLERHGFHYPIMVTEMEGLGLKLPPPTFSVLDVEQYVGKDLICCLMCSLTPQLFLWGGCGISELKSS